MKCLDIRGVRMRPGRQLAYLPVAATGNMHARDVPRMVRKSMFVNKARAGTVMAPPPTPNKPARRPEQTPMQPQRTFMGANGEKGCAETVSVSMSVSVLVSVSVSRCPSCGRAVVLRKCFNCVAGTMHSMNTPKDTFKALAGRARDTRAPTTAAVLAVAAR